MIETNATAVIAVDTDADAGGIDVEKGFRAIVHGGLLIVPVDEDHYRVFNRRGEQLSWFSPFMREWHILSVALDAAPLTEWLNNHRSS